jgi:hypothetical protein
MSDLYRLPTGRERGSREHCRSRVDLAAAGTVGAGKRSKMIVKGVVLLEDKNDMPNLGCAHGGCAWAVETKKAQIRSTESRDRKPRIARVGRNSTTPGFSTRTGSGA